MKMIRMEFYNGTKKNSVMMAELVREDENQFIIKNATKTGIKSVTHYENYSVPKRMCLSYEIYDRKIGTDGLRVQALKEIRSHGYYTFFYEMKENEKRYAIIRESHGCMVLEEIYKTKSNAIKVVEKMNNRDIATIKRVSKIHNPHDNVDCKWHMIEFTVNECLAV